MSDVVRSVTFDVPQIVASRDESLAVIEEPTDWRSHFTEITMSRLHRSMHARTLGKVKTYLGGIYRQFLRNGDVDIFLNGEPLTYDEPVILEAARYNDRDGEKHLWRKDVDIKLDSGRRVTGFVAIRETGSSEAGRPGALLPQEGRDRFGGGDLQAGRHLRGRQLLPVPAAVR